MLGTAYLTKILTYIKAHPHFVSLHPDLVKELEDGLEKASTGVGFDWTSLLPLIMMILQMLFAVPVSPAPPK